MNRLHELDAVVAANVIEDAIEMPELLARLDSTAPELPSINELRQRARDSKQRRCGRPKPVRHSRFHASVDATECDVEPIATVSCRFDDQTRHTDRAMPSA